MKIVTVTLLLLTGIQAFASSTTKIGPYQIICETDGDSGYRNNQEESHQSKEIAYLIDRNRADGFPILVSTAMYPEDIGSGRSAIHYCVTSQKLP